MSSKTSRVKALFEVPTKYLAPRQFDIRVRQETILEFASDTRYECVLDVGCGDGSLSLPLLPQASSLTLVDISINMLALTEAKVPHERRSDVKLINGDVMQCEFQLNSYDLVLCVGVLAHVDSPADLIARLGELVKPNGMIIIEFTDSYRLWGLPVVIYRKLLNLIRPAPYDVNRLRREQIVGICRRNGLVLQKMFQYGLPPIGSHKILNQQEMYSWIRRTFGSVANNRRRGLANQYLCQFRRLATEETVVEE